MTRKPQQKPQTPPPETDWRKLPRKPAASKRTATIQVRLTPAELARLKDLALSAGLTLADYVRTRALSSVQTGPDSC